MDRTEVVQFNRLAGVEALRKISIGYEDINLRDLKMEVLGNKNFSEEDDSDSETEFDRANLRVNVRASLGGENLNVSDRFWTSFAARYGLSKSVFAYFSPDEVFSRVSEKTGVGSEARVRVAVERTPEQMPRLLAVTAPGREILTFDRVLELAQQYNSKGLMYDDGQLTSVYTPRSGAHPFSIGGDEFANRFAAQVPVDGYGKPNIYLAMLRLVCTNGLVAFHPSFRTPVTMGQQPTLQLVRLLEGFDHGEGFSAFRDRLSSAQRTPASVRESLSLMKIFDSCSQRQESSWASISFGDLIPKFNSLTGDLANMYGINPGALAERRSRLFPAKCTVYDLINFATEIGTHYGSVATQRRLGGWAGEMLSGMVGQGNHQRPKEFDLEGTGEAVSSFAARYFEGGLDLSDKAAFN